MIPGGWLADRLGPHRVLFWVGAGAGIATGLTAICGPNGLGAVLGVLGALVLVRFLLGLVTSPIYPACARTNVNCLPQH